jgi:SET domain-containing protein
LDLNTVKKREEEATSKDTLKDIEESSTDTKSDDTDGPSPDGTLDEPEELHDADPM